MIRDRNPQPAETRPPDGDQESLRGLDSHAEVLDPSTDEIAPGKRTVVHSHQYTLLLPDVPGMEPVLF